MSERYGTRARVPPQARMRTPMTPASDTGLRVRALADQAVSAALEADWTRASDPNAKTSEAAPDDIEARNRMGRALLEQGKLEEAKASFAEVLKAEPYNSIAIRGSSRIAPPAAPHRQPRLAGARPAARAKDQADRHDAPDAAPPLHRGHGQDRNPPAHQPGAA